MQVCAHLQWIGISAKLTSSTTHLNYGIHLLSISIPRTLQCCVSSSPGGTILVIDRFSITHSFDKERGFPLRCWLSTGIYCVKLLQWRRKLSSEGRVVVGSHQEMIKDDGNSIVPRRLLIISATPPVAVEWNHLLSLASASRA